MQKILFIFILSCMYLYANHSYTAQIKVVDRCTHLAEPLRIKELGIKGIMSKDMGSQKVIRACEKSMREHPEDPHVKFLLARAYTKGNILPKDINFPKKVLLTLPELNGPSPQYALGYALAKASCQAGDIGGCTLLGGYYEQGLGVSRNGKKSYLLWLWSCQKGSGLACNNLAYKIGDKNRYIPKDSKTEAAYLMETCVSGSYPNACSIFSDRMYFKKIPYNEAAFQYSTYQACIYGERSACYHLEKFIKENENAKEISMEMQKTSCNNGNAKACEALGSMYANMPKNRVNNLMALTFFEDGCKSSAIHFSCWYAGTYKILSLEGVTQDIPQGLKYWEKSCYLGTNSFACYDLATFYFHTENESYRDKQKGEKAIKLACKIGNARAMYLGCDRRIDICCKEKEKYETSGR